MATIQALGNVTKVRGALIFVEDIERELVFYRISSWQCVVWRARKSATKTSSGLRGVSSVSSGTPKGTRSSSTSRLLCAPTPIRSGRPGDGSGRYRSQTIAQFPVRGLARQRGCNVARLRHASARGGLLARGVGDTLALRPLGIASTARHGDASRFGGKRSVVSVIVAGFVAGLLRHGTERPHSADRTANGRRGRDSS